MKLVGWLGWLLTFMFAACVGSILGAIAGAIAGPVKVLSWLTEDVVVVSNSPNDSI